MRKRAGPGARTGAQSTVWTPRTLPGSGWGWGGGDRGQGQAELEAGAGAAEGGVTDDQLPVLGAGQLAGNVEAEADPAGPPGGAGVELGEALEDALAVGRLDPGAGVLDGQHGPGAVAGRLQADRAVVRSEED